MGSRDCQYRHESALVRHCLVDGVGGQPPCYSDQHRALTECPILYLVPGYRPLSGVWDKIRDHISRVRKLAVKVHHLDTLNPSLGSPIFAPNLQTLDIHKIAMRNRPLPLFFNGDKTILSSIWLRGMPNWPLYCSE